MPKLKSVLIFASILGSWLAVLPWLVTLGAVSVPETLVIMFTPPPYGFQPVAYIDYTIKVALALAIEILPLASICIVPFVLVRKSSRMDDGVLRATAHLLWIKSAVTFIALALAQLFLGLPYLTAYLTSLDTLLLLAVSPLLALAALGLLLAKAKVKGEPGDGDDHDSLGDK